MVLVKDLSLASHISLRALWNPNWLSLMSNFVYMHDFKDDFQWFSVRSSLLLDGLVHFFGSIKNVDIKNISSVLFLFYLQYWINPWLSKVSRLEPIEYNFLYVSNLIPVVAVVYHQECLLTFQSRFLLFCVQKLIPCTILANTLGPWDLPFWFRMGWSLPRCLRDVPPI